MAARRLLLVMLVLLVISTVIAMITPQPESPKSTPDEVTTTGTSGASGASGGAGQAGTTGTTGATGVTGATGRGNSTDANGAAGAAGAAGQGDKSGGSGLASQNRGANEVGTSGGGPGVLVTATIQPTGSPATIEASPGGRVILLVKVSDTADIEIAGLGRVATATPYAPARFDLVLPPTPGSYAVRQLNSEKIRATIEARADN